MPQFLDNLSVTSALRMLQPTPGREHTRFTARFVIEAGPLRLTKEFDFSEQPEASRSLRRLANDACADWLQTLATGLAAGTAVSAVQIDVDDKGWAKVVLRDETEGLADITVEIPEANDFEAMERAAIAKLEDFVRRALHRQE